MHAGCCTPVRVVRSGLPHSVSATVDGEPLSPGASYTLLTGGTVPPHCDKFVDGLKTGTTLCVWNLSALSPMPTLRQTAALAAAAVLATAPSPQRHPVTAKTIAAGTGPAEDSAGPIL